VACIPDRFLSHPAASTADSVCLFASLPSVSRVDKNEFEFTPEFTSLAVRRASVSVAANTLRRAD
jgi:hypothetical protein